MNSQKMVLVLAISLLIRTPEVDAVYPTTLDEMCAAVNPLTNDWTGRIPLIVWWPPEQTNLDSITNHIDALAARGIVPALTTDISPSENVTLGLALQARGLPVHYNMKAPYLPDGVTPDWFGWVGLYADSPTVLSWSDLAGTNVAWPAYPIYNTDNWSGIESKLEAVANFGVTVDNVWFDFEGLPTEWNGGYWSQVLVEQAYPGTYPAGVLGCYEGIWNSYLFSDWLNTVLITEIYDRGFADHVHAVFPSAHVGQYYRYRCNRDYSDRHYTYATPLSRLNISQPVLYPWSGWLTSYYGATDSISQVQADCVYVTGLLPGLTGSGVSKLRGDLIVPYLSYVIVNTVDPHYDIPLSSAMMRELVRHALLRGADSFCLFDDLNDDPDTAAYPFFNDVCSAYDEMLAHRDILDYGQAVNFDVGTVTAPRPIWSGLWCSNQCLVRATSLTGTNASITAVVFPGGIPTTFSAPTNGATYVFDRLALGGSRIAHWMMESNLWDALAFRYDATAHGSAVYTNGIQGELACQFDGTSAYLTTPGLVGGFSMCGTNDFTWEAWVNPVDPDAPCQVLFGENNAANSNEYARIQLVSGAIEVRIVDADTGECLSYKTGATLPANTWSHVEVVRTGLVFTTYLNGEAAASGTCDPDTLSFAGGKTFTMAAADGPNQSSFFAGRLDDVRLYDRALTPAELRADYRWGSGLVAWYRGEGDTRDSSLHNNDAGRPFGDVWGTRQGDIAFSSDAMEGSNSLSLNGVNASLQVQCILDDVRMSDPEREFTFSGWFKTANPSVEQDLYTEQTMGVWDEFARIGISGGTVTVGIKKEDWLLNLSSTATLASDTWYFLAVSKTGNQFTIYLNGKAYGSATYSGAELAPPDCQYRRIGATYLDGMYYRFFNGLLDDIQIRNKGLDAMQVGCVWREYAAAPPPCTLDTPTNIVIEDSSANIPLEVLANGTVGTITNVSFYADGVLVGTLANPTGPYSYTWTNATYGAYTVTAVVAYDNYSVCVTSAAVTVTVRAKRYVFDSANGDWGVAGNWSPALVPLAGEWADVYGSGAGSMAALTDTRAADAFSVGGDLVTNWSGVGVLNVGTGGALTGGGLFVGVRGQGAVIQQGGSVMASVLGVGVCGGSGVYTQRGGQVTITTNATPCAGWDAAAQASWDSAVVHTGQWVMTGGMLQGNGFKMGCGSNTMGVIALSGGLITMDDEYMGVAGGEHVISQSGGTNAVAQSLVVGCSNALCAYNLSGGLLEVGDLYIGGTAADNGSTGSVTQTGGMLAAGTLTVAGETGNVGSYTASNGMLSVSNLTVGASSGQGVGTFRVVGMQANLAVTNYTQHAGASLAVTLGAAGLSPIRVGGTATLAGTLELGCTANAYPNPSTVVTVMTYIARSGTFAQTNVAARLVGCQVNYQAASITLSGFPLTWTNLHIGAYPGDSGATVTGGVFTVNGKGAGIASTADSFRFMYVTTTGDCTIVARVTNFSSTVANARAGVMMRASTNANSIEASALFYPGSVKQVYFHRRTSTGGSTSTSYGSATAVPYWVKLARTGNTLRAYRSANGASWSQVGANTTVTLGNPVLVGLAVTSGSTTSSCTGTFDNVSITWP